MKVSSGVVAYENADAVPRRWKWIGFAVFLAVAVALPFLLEGYSTYRLALVGAMAVAVLGVNLLIGQSGQISIGHGAFFAIGAYSAAIAMNNFGLSAYRALPIAAAVSFVAGFLLGWPALRFGTIHLILLTWGASLVLPQVLKLDVLQPWTGGVNGIYFDRPQPPAWSGLGEDRYWYFVVLAVMIVFFWIAGNLVQSRSGRALAAIRDNEIAAASAGIDVRIFKTVIFGISAMYVGVGGALTGLLDDFIAPDSYGLFFSFLLLIGAVAAGFGSVWGALIGGFLILFLPTTVASLPAALAVPPAGFFILLVIYFMPDGFTGLMRRGYRRYRQRGIRPKR